MLLPSEDFSPRRYGLGAWTDNIHFAYDLVATLRPRLLVELGTDRGESYFSFCQAAAEHGTGTQCFAIDTWQGDHQTGSYDETTFAEVTEHNSAYYADFSTLLRCDFDEALPQFSPESIDLLHIDGLHTEEAVRHDVETWLPKLAPGGVLLMHDVAVRTGDFGVWKVWEEMLERGRAFTFTKGPGLGVWQKPPGRPLPAPVETLLAGEISGREATVAFYEGRTRALHERIAQQWQDGTIRETAIADQTTLQIFHTHDGTHSEGNSISARVGHEVWQEVAMALPPGAGAAPLRLDFFSALTLIDVSSLRVEADGRTLFSAETPEEFDRIAIGGDAVRHPHPRHLRIEITGVDPQLYLPEIRGVAPNRLTLSLRLKINRGGLEHRL